MSRLVAGGGIALGLVALAASPPSGRAAADQLWPPFVLVAGLLLVGRAADDDGVFRWAGLRLAERVGHPVALFAGASALVACVTAVLNLDTSVAFMTPVLVAAARASGDSAAGRGALLYGCLLLSNAASLLLPGSNLTNLIVLGHLHLAGSHFAARMALPWVAAVSATAVVVGLWFVPLGWRRRSGAGPPSDSDGHDSPARAPRPGLAGLLAVAAATAAVLLLRNAAVAVLVAGMAAFGITWWRRRESGTSGWAMAATREAVAAAGGSIVLGLFGVALAAGTLGRWWDGPSRLLAHAGTWATAGIGAASSVAVNNLPAASLLAARHAHHPFALLVGLDIGPNLAVTGSLSSLLWWRSARRAGARPSLLRVSAIGLVAAPLAGAVALGTLAR